jgi:hypothetical protein
LQNYPPGLFLVKDVLYNSIKEECEAFINVVAQFIGLSLMNQATMILPSLVGGSYRGNSHNFTLTLRLRSGQA